MKNLINFIFIIFLLSSFSFFELTIIDKSILNFFSLIFLFLSILIYLIYSEKSRPILNPIRKFINIFIFSLVVSLFSVSFLKNQSLADSLFAYYPFFSSLFILFFLSKFRIPPNFINKSIFAMGVFYSLIIIFQLFFSDNLLFGSTNTSIYTISRFNVLGSSVLIYSLFFSLINFKNRVNKVCFFLFLFTVFLLQSRTSIILSSLLISYYVTFNSKLYIKILSIVVVFIISFNINNTKILNTIYSDLFNKSLYQYDSGLGQLQRYNTYNFFINYDSSIFQKIFGNGVASYGRSNFGKDIEYYEKNNILSLQDSSILYLYIYIGIFGLVSFLILIIYTITKLKIPDKHLYLKYFLIYCLFSSVVSYNLSHFSYFSLLIVTIYLITYFNNFSKITYQ